MNNMIKNLMKNALIGAVSMLAVAGVANAATVSVVPSVTSIVPGGTFTATVVADLTDVGGFTDGGFDLSWDTSVLSLVGGTNGVAAELQVAFDAFDALHPGYAPFPAHSNTLLDETPPTALLQFIFTNCGLGLFDTKCETIGDTEAIDLYELTFQISDTATVGVAAPTLLGAQWLLAGPNGEINPNDPTIPDYISASVEISAVPVPPAVWLFGSGLLGLVGVARRRRS
jgi:hypothetical protein